MRRVVNDNVSCFIQKHSVAKRLPTRHVINVFPRLKLLDTLTNFTPLAVYLIKSFTTNKIYLHRACSGFETEPQVLIRTWTWNAGNSTYGIFCHFCYKDAPRPSSSFVCRELKADSKVVVTDAETAPDSVTRVKVRVSTWMFRCNCHVHDAP
jgi:hypothetical protein